MRRDRARRITRTTIAVWVLAVSGVLVGVSVAGGPRSALDGTTATTTTVPTSGKVTICHRTHSTKNPGVTISVSVKAWPAHQRHGDILGACVRTTTTTTSSTGTTTGSIAASTASTGGGHGHSGEHGRGAGRGHNR